MKQLNNGTIHTIFFGTHDFAARILQGLIDNPLLSVGLVISRPDEPVGRKQIVQKTPVKILAEKFGIPVEQPESLKDYGLRTTDYGLGITAQYGGLIPKHILEAPTHGILNVHTSLLPKYRGASPVQSAIMNGEKETGITIMKMDEGLDTGPILLQKKIPIGEHTTAPELEKMLAALGVEALIEAIPPYLNGTLLPKEQDHPSATTCQKLTREDGRIDWRRGVRDIYNQYRGLLPWPGVWTMWNGKRIKLISLRPAHHVSSPGAFSFLDDHLYIGCADGSVEIMTIQLEGKREMPAEEFVRGHRNDITEFPSVNE